MEGRKQLRQKEVLQFLRERGVTTSKGNLVKLADVQGYCKRMKFPEQFPFILELDKTIENSSVKLYNIIERKENEIAD